MGEPQKQSHQIYEKGSGIPQLYNIDTALLNEADEN